jgi:hypothetical protein
MAEQMRSSPKRLKRPIWSAASGLSPIVCNKETLFRPTGPTEVMAGLTADAMYQDSTSSMAET